MFACWEKCFHEIFCIFLWGASYPDIRNKIIIGHAVYHPCEEYFRIYKDFTCYMQRIIVCMYVCFLVMVWLGKFLSFLVNKGLFYKCKRGWKGDEIKWCMVLNPLEINSLWKKIICLWQRIGFKGEVASVIEYSDDHNAAIINLEEECILEAKFWLCWWWQSFPLNWLRFQVF